MRRETRLQFDTRRETRDMRLMTRRISPCRVSHVSCRRVSARVSRFTSVDFKTIIWRNGYAPDRVDLQAQKGASRGASQGTSRGASRIGGQGAHLILSMLAQGAGALSSTEVAHLCGRDRANGYLKRILGALTDDGLVETTSERRRGARQQKYRLTAKGLDVVKKVTACRCVCGPVNEPVNEPLNEPVNEPVKSAVLEAVRQSPGVKRPDLLRLVGKSRATVGRAISALCQQHMIEHRGSAKTGGYYPVKKGGGR